MPPPLTLASDLLVVVASLRACISFPWLPFEALTLFAGQTELVVVGGRGRSAAAAIIATAPTAAAHGAASAAAASAAPTVAAASRVNRVGVARAA